MCILLYNTISILMFEITVFRVVDLRSEACKIHCVGCCCHVIIAVSGDSLCL